MDALNDSKLVAGTNKMSARMRSGADDMGGKENEHVGRVNVSSTKI